MVGRGKIVYIGLGSNLGQRIDILCWAINQLAKQLTVIEYSPIYQTPADTWVSQYHYCNAVVMGRTLSSPWALLKKLQALEQQAGRRPTQLPWRARPLDCDLLAYQGFCSRHPQLICPHPRWSQRAFVTLLSASLSRYQLWKTDLSQLPILPKCQ